MIIASFWADTDTSIRGTITYSFNNDSVELARAEMDILGAYPTLASSFVPSYYFVVTQRDVAYFNETDENLMDNTFKV